MRFTSTAHFFALIGVYFSTRYEIGVIRKGMNRLPIAVLFAFGNLFVYRYYKLYFYRRSFEKKYKDVDDISLENIIKSLEAFKLKVH